MKQIIAAHTSGSKVDWVGAAGEYFAWYKVHHPELTPSPRPANWVDMQRLAEAAIKSKLVDPTSAQFEWTNGFSFQTYRSLFSKEITGPTTCGFVNARDRAGGYSGRAAFIVIMSQLGDSVAFAEIDEPGSDIIARQCARAHLPPLGQGMASSTPNAAASAGETVADQLTKLAALRDKGYLTEQEFEQQKQLLLRQ